MRFGPVPVERSTGAILAHAMTVGSLRLRKSHRLTASDVDALVAAGISEIIAAVLEPDDRDENAASAAIAGALRASGIEAKAAATGRVNLHATAAGVFTVDKALIDAINGIDPAVTLATLPHHAAVGTGQMVATVKIIPFAVPKSIVDQALALAGSANALAVHPFEARGVGLIQTILPGLKPSVLDKTVRVTETRLARSGSHIVAERRPRHDAAELAGEIRSLAGACEMVIVFGASAMSDPDDVVPAAIRLAGGTVIRAGMPVDPGNLLVLGTIGGKPVLGAPGCARSPKENGFDWVLDRILSGIDVGAADIAAMGVGGLLMEIPTRPQPREMPGKNNAPEVHAVLLAAGRSSRMGGSNKLLADFGGKALVRRQAERVLASRARSLTVVVGHEASRIRDALAGLEVAFAYNPAFAEGLASSLQRGVAALPEATAGALIVLGDMPEVSAENLDRLIGAFERASGSAIVRATHEGKRGNPVILPRSVFPDIEAIEGDTGARHIVESSACEVIDVEIGRAASVDVDTPEALRAAGGVPKD